MLDTFRYQWDHCPPYRQWCDLLGVEASHVDQWAKIPFLPIEVFRQAKVYSSAVEHDAELVFTSSGTTSAQTSQHFVASAEHYIETFTDGFTKFYGDPAAWSIFALLPGYLDRKGSSLVYMVDKLHKVNALRGGFFSDNIDLFHESLVRAVGRGERIMVVGVTFALVSYAERFRIGLPAGSVVMETGGMKGRGREIARAELHAMLGKAFGVDAIHSEYGMTELLSQGYSPGGGVFYPIDTLRVVGRALDNPLEIVPAAAGRVVGLNVVDLANLYSCSFLATGDKGTVHPDGSFEVHGRIEGEILRGCNMLL